MTRKDSISPQNSLKTCTTGIPLTCQTVERFPLGYPQFSALIGAHPTFSVFRRFSVIRARLLLLKQQRMTALEKQLEQLDFQEPRALHLGSIQADTNAARIQILKDLDEALADYGELHESSPVHLLRRDSRVMYEKPNNDPRGMPLE